MEAGAPTAWRSWSDDNALDEKKVRQGRGSVPPSGFPEHCISLMTRGVTVSNQRADSQDKAANTGKEIRRRTPIGIETPARNI
jgi:hypothetical protein